MKLLLLADVSGSTAHVGDEAMLEANVALFRELLPRCEITVAAGAGWDGNALAVKVVRRLDFSHHSENERDEWLKLLTAESSLENHPAAVAALSCDALIISGGGNLGGNWPHHIYERIAMARLASSRGAKIILLGQTLGPEFRARERILMTELLRLSIWTGLRETYSYALALELGACHATLSYQVDDAMFLEPRRPPQNVLQDLMLSEDRPWIAVTLHPLCDASARHPTVARLASCLQSIAHLTGADLVFLPHVSFDKPGVTSGDEAFGVALARAMYGNPKLRIAPLLSAAETAWMTQQAALVISSRYHPLVFGLGAAISCVGLWSDEYTRRKIQGALIHADRSEDAIELEDALDSRLVSKALELWHARSGLKVELQARMKTWHEAENGRKRSLAQSCSSSPS